MGFTEKKFIDVILAFDLPSFNLHKKLVITFSSKSSLLSVDSKNCHNNNQSFNILLKFVLLIRDKEKCISAMSFPLCFWLNLFFSVSSHN